MADELIIRDLSLGDSGDDVVVLQTILIKRGYALPEPGIDGIFGRATEAFVVHFQWAHGLNMDGVVGGRTQTALGLTVKPPAKEGDSPVLAEVDELELGIGEPLADHADVLDHEEVAQQA